MKNQLQNLALIASICLTYGATAQEQFLSYALYDSEAEYMWERFDNGMDYNDHSTVESEMSILEEIVVIEEAAESMTLIEQIKLDSEIKVYPNPAMEDIQISYEIYDAQRLSLRLYDLQGTLVKTFFSDELKNEGDHTNFLNIESQEKGNYILVLNSPTHSKALPFQKN